jgi:RNA polymerase sigma factor (sigma-70 family)
MSNEIPGNRQFLTTHWSVVRAAGESDQQAAANALAELCQVYWYPIYAYVRRQNIDSNEAADLTQGFFTNLIEREDIQNVDPSRGRFRSFLLVALKNYMHNQRDRQNAQKRGGHLNFIPLDSQSADRRYCNEPNHNETAETLFEKRWAESVLQQAQIQLAKEFAKSKKAQQFDRLKLFLAGPVEHVSYGEVADELGMTEVAVKVAIHRMKQRFGQILRSEIAQTVESESEIDEEIGHLFQALKK